MKQRVVIADDDPMAVSLIESCLSRAGYEIHTTTNGIAALTMIERVDPAVAILDINMPGLDGLAVLRQLKEDARLRHIPVMMLTGEGDPARVSDALDGGAGDYVLKPFKNEELIVRVGRLAASVERIYEPLPPQSSDDFWII